MFRQKTLKYNIRGDEWKIVVYSPSIYVKRLGQDSAALTETDKKFIAFDAGEMTEGIVLHELVHVFVSYLNHDDANLTIDQFEEMMATMIERSGKELISISEDIWKKISKYKITLDESEKI